MLLKYPRARERERAYKNERPAAAAGPASEIVKGKNKRRRSRERC